MKNGQIEFWRFAFSIYMVVYHTLGHVYGIQTGGYIGVDIFLILSGFFLAKSHEKGLQAEPGKQPEKGSYFRSRFLRLWPMYLCAFFVSVALWGIRTHQSPAGIFEKIYRSFPEMFMLRMNPSVNGVTWFVCAMLLAGAVLWAILSLDRQHAVCGCVLPVCTLLIYSRFETTVGRIHFIATQQAFSIYYDGFWRAFAAMSLGVIAFGIAKRLDHTLPISSAVRPLFSVCGNAMLTTVLCVSIFKYHGFCDFWFIFLAFCAVICLSLPSKCTKPIYIYIYILHNTVCRLGALAYPIYLLHEAVFTLLKTYQFVRSPIAGCTFVAVATILEAALLSYFLKKASVLMGPKIKSLFQQNL